MTSDMIAVIIFLVFFLLGIPGMVLWMRDESKKSFNKDHTNFVGVTGPTTETFDRIFKENLYSNGYPSCIYTHTSTKAIIKKYPKRYPSMMRY